MKYYHEQVGECVNQVYEIEADSWGDAKKKAFDDMAVGDRIVQCDGSAVREYDESPEYHYIEEDLCKEYATLEKGCWACSEETDTEYWEERAYSFSDDPETYLDGNGNEFDDWE